MPDFRELSIPSTLIADETDGFEVIRFWVGGGTDHVSLQLMQTADGKTDIKAWGNIAADIIKHAVRAIMQDDPSLDKEVVTAEIEQALVKRLSSNVNLAGQLKGTTN